MCVNARRPELLFIFAVNFLSPGLKMVKTWAQQGTVCLHNLQCLGHLRKINLRARAIGPHSVAMYNFGVGKQFARSISSFLKGAIKYIDMKSNFPGQIQARGPERRSSLRQFHEVISTWEA